jgi:outer membrane protein OmpA-like peptidoglycan-associated protein
MPSFFPIPNPVPRSAWLLSVLCLWPTIGMGAGYLNDRATTQKLGGVGNYLFRGGLDEAAARDIEEASSSFVEIVSFSQSIPEREEIDGAEWVDTIEFENESAEITAAENSKIRIIAEKMKSDLELNAEVTGYADAIGKESANETLPSARARAVTESLRQHGVPPARVFWTGSRGTEAGQNRRVEIRYR